MNQSNFSIFALCQEITTFVVVKKIVIKFYIWTPQSKDIFKKKKEVNMPKELKMCHYMA